MGRRSFLGLAVVACALSFVAGRAFTDEGKSDPAHDQGMEEMMKAAAPGPEHKWLAESAGTWDVTAKFWFGPEPTETKGSAVLEPILGGRFVRQVYKGEMSGQPFEGLGIMGYSNLQKEFQSVWFDTWSTTWFAERGTLDPATKVLKTTGEMLTPQGPMQTRSELTRPDGDTLVMKAWASSGHGEMQTMELTYKRRK